METMMPKTRSHLGLSRRDALKLLAVAGVTAAGGYLLYESTPWLDYDQQVIPARRPIDPVAAESAHRRELVRYATLAANGHNTQPWRFTIADDSIEIHPDLTRRLPIVDPLDRELWISLGCALENLIVAARATGYEAEVTYPEAEDMIRIRLLAATASADPLFDAIPRRQSTRSEYDQQSIPSADLAQLQALPLEPGVTLHLIASAAGRETVLEYVNQGNLRQYADPAFVDELIAWLRFNKRDALASLDGLYSRCSGNPEVPRWFGQLVVATTTPERQADADARKLRSSPAAVVIASDADTKATWVRTGQVYERLALTATALNIKSALLNQSIEVAGLRAQFQSAMGLGASLPQLVMRVGYAHALPRSPRRPIAHVISSVEPAGS
jgi:Nitroreductase family